MPSLSQAQRAWAFGVKGPAWAKAHHFDNPGKLPQYVHAAKGDSNIGLHIFRQHVAILPKTPTKAPAEGEHPKITYPADHLMGMRVPIGGSSCAKCEYVSADMKNCGNDLFVRWNFGDSKLPNEANSYCCDMYSPAKGTI